jgi:anti-anti-sigma factor
MGFQVQNGEPGTLHLFGDLDLAAYEGLAEALNATSGPITLDVAGVSFMDSTGLRVVLQRLQAGPVTIQSPTRQVARLLELSGLSEVDGFNVAP